MSSYLSYGGFNSLKNVDNFDINLVSKKSPVGYIFEVDVEWIHALHNDYPLAPEKLAVPYDMLSDFCKKNADETKNT